MKCHYEILGILKDADVAEIKSAYRKFALKWHPDKNLDNTECATEQFQLVQQAYEVLSDPQERAWYDKHREQILRGASSEFEDKSLDVFQFFTTTCFKGYGDDEKGFYTIYRTVFDQLIKEELEFIEDKSDFCEIPRFGCSTSDYEETVGPFYAYWCSYSTKKSYVWLDPYNINEARDRKIFKLIEKENKKVRQKAKKERNEEIRNLVAFVRKRDKRVQEHTKLNEARILENRQKQEELSKQKRRERHQQLNESGAQAEWSKFDNVQSELEEIEKSLAEQFGEELSNSDDECQNIEDFYCAVCSKVFKTLKSYKNHESSKKHKENVETLKQLMLEETELDDLSLQEEFTDEESDSSLQKKKKQKKKKKKVKNTLTVDNKDTDLKLQNAQTEEDNDSVDFDLTKQKKKNSHEDFTDEESDSSLETTKKQKQKNKKVKNISTVDDNKEADLKLQNAKTEGDDSDLTTKQKKKNSRKSNKNNPMATNAEAPEIAPEQQNGVNKKKQIKTDPEIAPEKQNGVNKKKQNKTDNVSNAEVDTSHCCVTCRSAFPSKNKLFDHLKKTGHGVYLPNKNVKHKSQK